MILPLIPPAIPASNRPSLLQFCLSPPELVAAAREEAEGEEIPAPDCEDIGEWEIELQCVSDAILWDADYDDEYLYADRSPEESTALRKMAGINEEYYQYIAEDLKDEEIENTLAELRKLCGRFVKE